ATPCQAHGPPASQARMQAVDIPPAGRSGVRRKRGRMPDPAARPIRSLPSARDHRRDILTRLREARTAVFLDYDGTLTPIVPDPAQAVLSAETRSVIQRLAELCPVAVISGRDLPDVRALV